MRKKLRTWVALALCLTACAAPRETTPEVPSSLAPVVAEDAPAEGPAAPSTVETALPPEEETTDLPAEENEEEPAAVLASEAIFPRSFSFASGAGGWSTELEVAADGSFTGLYHDTDDGMVSIYSMRLEHIEQKETEGEELAADGILYIGARPHGLDGAEEILVYLPGSQRQDLPEGFVSWVNTFNPWDTEDGRSQSGEDRLTRYGLYNVSCEQGFVSVEE